MTTQYQKHSQKMNLLMIRKLIAMVLMLIMIVGIFMMCEPSAYANDIPSNDNIAATESVFVSVVESSYRDACSLTEHNLSRKYNSFTDTTAYFYKGLIIQSADAEWLKSSSNTEKTLNQGALYRSVAKYLVGFSMGLNDGRDYASLLCGQPWKDRASFEPYVKNAATFIVMAEQEQMKAIMQKFQNLSSVTGEYNFNAGGLGKYNVFIPDLTACAEEMQISEEMLGYILALLDEYAPDISFDNNSCRISYGI